MFDSRATATEFLDLPDCDPELAAASYRFMETVNRRFGGIITVQRFLSGEIQSHPSRLPLRILDIGSGSCDIPLALCQWAHSRGTPLHFTCLEMTDHAVDLARSRLVKGGNPPIQVLQEDAFAHSPDEPYDCAVASMCFHHFSDAQILALLKHLRGFVRSSVLINDLRRSRLSSLSARLLLAGTRAPAGVRHDDLLSIQRGFKTKELRTLLQQLDNVTVSVKPVPWFRVSAIIQF